MKMRDTFTNLDWVEIAYSFWDTNSQLWGSNNVGRLPHKFILILCLVWNLSSCVFLSLTYSNPIPLKEPVLPWNWYIFHHETLISSYFQQVRLYKINLNESISLTRYRINSPSGGAYKNTQSIHAHSQEWGQGRSLHYILVQGNKLYQRNKYKN